ncbi:MAG: hypothetical protein ACOWWH_00460 [Eubacteriaceae bacterium]
MSVKAREIVKRQSITYKQLIIIFAVLIGFDLIMKYIQDRVEESLKFGVNITVSILSIILLYLLITKILPRYELMVLENDFVIYRSLLFKPKIVFSTPLNQISHIHMKYESDKFSGKKHNYTLLGIKDKINYILICEKGIVHFQSSKKFTEKLEKTINKRKK